MPRIRLGKGEDDGSSCPLSSLQGRSDEAPKTKQDEWLTRALRALVAVDLEVAVFLAGALAAVAFALEAGARPVTA